ncbi:hypothetical protein HMPREF9996_00229 [Aggregatibacter actinomycetemcomitans Y4]|nr:hypothetical protein HMPREF9996_00229 [Aggregatibacter actinomycetemcomitans Y4]
MLTFLCFNPFSKKTLAICPKNGRINVQLFNGTFTILCGNIVQSINIAIIGTGSE